MDRDEFEKVLMRLRTKTDEAESEAGHARDRLARIGSGMTPLLEVNAEEVEGAADDFAAAVRKLQMLSEVGRELRQLLI